jgi:hypothetical protein
MPMNEPEERFEQYLQQFRPVMPRALATPARRPVPWGAVAVAGAMFVVIGLAALRHAFPPALTRGTQPLNIAPMLRLRRAATPHPITVGQLNLALRENDQDFDQFLNDASPRTLPQEHRGTALYELSKD